MKKHTTKLLAVLLALTFAVVLSACKSNPETAETTTAKTTAAASDDSSAPTSTNTDLFTDRDLDPSYDSATTIDLNKESSRVTITEAGTYVLTGTLHGQVVVKVADTDKVQLVLNNATITNNTSAAIYVQSGDKVFITTAEGSRNTVSSSATFTSADEETGDNVDGAIFSKATLTFNGSGKLTVNCDNGHGVVSKDDLKVTGGTLDVTAAKKGLAGKDSIRIHDGTITVKAGGDGLHTSNDTDTDKGFVYIEGGSLSIASGDDGIHAETDLSIKGGKISVTQSEEGLEGQNIDLSGGTIDIVSTDDGLNASEGSSGTDNTDDFGGYGHGGGFGANQNASLTISGGTIHVNAQGDALDSNGSMVVSGGTVYVSGPTNGGNGAIDCDNAQITGGTVIAAGSAGMDLYACIGEAVTIPPHEIRVIPTGIAIELESPAYVAY
ncbi:MAG: carbohydrate-binding domain-containing protein, partial [Clostridia bacterium]|nr:carbohydrate-binding domain-containing protein [Clostridia bacterium]